MNKDDAAQPRHLHHIEGEVFGDEIDAILARREAVAKRPNPGDHQAPASTAGGADELREALIERGHVHPEKDKDIKPDPDLGLAGLAISGGGIRSATFNLGVIQVFAKRGLLRWFDYLSTVSGGGYIGSALSSTLLFETKVEGGGGEKAPFGESFVHMMGKEEPQLLKHLRSGRDYLAPGGLHDMARIPAILLRGIVVNLLVVAPLIGLLAILSAIVPPFGVFPYQFEFTGFSPEQLGRGDVILENAAVFFLPTLLFAALFVAWSILFPIIAKLRPRNSWAQRNRFELSFSTCLMAIGAVGVVNLLPWLYYIVFNGTLENTPPWRVAVAAVAAVLPVATSLRNAAARTGSFNRVFDKLKLLAAALLGPLILLSMYLGMAHLELTPLTVPFGDLDSALNVSARVLDDELDQETSAILALDDNTPYVRWVKQLHSRVAGDDDRWDKQPFYRFLAFAMLQEQDSLASSLQQFKRTFGPAIWLRTSPLGMALFGGNRFVEPLAGDLTASNLTAGDLLFLDPPPDDQIVAAVKKGNLLELARASEALRKDLVVMHSAILAFIMVAIFLYVGLFVNINKTGLHRFYRDRLSRAYLFDPSDPEGAAGTADNLKLSAIDPKYAGNPYHLVNAALNIPTTEIPDLQGRRCDFFAMTPRHCGSSANGYYPTTYFEEHWDPDTTLATAFAISGAAAAPQMGVNTSKSLQLIMTLLNIRLDYWVPNPKVLGEHPRAARRVPGPTYLLREISGQMNVRTPFVNLSDGGHIENLGLYELLRRRCKYIVACDAEQDPNMILSSLGKLTAYARMDEGIWIDWGGTLERLARDPETGFSIGHWAVGRIHYGSKEGRIVYIKSSMCGSEWPDQMAYKAKHPEFPQQSTGDQFFDEEQFEAYRALGYLIASQLFDEKTYHVDDIDAWFGACEKRAGATYVGDHTEDAVS